MTPDPSRSKRDSRGVLTSLALGFCVFYLGRMVAVWLTAHNVHGFSAFLDNVAAGAVAGLVVLFYERSRQRLLKKANQEVTERRRAEETVRESVRRFDDLAEQSRTTNWEVDRQGLFTYVSHVSQASWGYRPDEVVGRMHFYNLHPEEGREAFKAAVFAVVERMEPFRDVVHAVETKDGRIVWGSTNGIPLLNADGTLRGYRGSCTDITERKQAEDALKESEEKLRSVFASTPDSITVVDLDGRITLCNQPTANIHGFSSVEKLIGKSVLELVAEEDRQRAEEAKQHVMIHGIARNLLFTGLKSNGEKFPAELSFSLMKGGSGRPIGFVGITHDITERRRAEEELRSSEVKYRTLVETTGTGYLIIDSQGRVLDANQEYVRLSGHGALREILGRSVIEWTAKGAKQRNAEAVAQCAKDGFIRNFVTEYVDGKGRATFILVNATVEGKGESLRIVSLCRDVTEHKRMEQELRWRESELREAQRVAQVGSWTQDTKTGVLTWSDEMYRIHGRDPSLPPPTIEELPQLFTADSREQLNASRDAALQTGQVAHHDLQVFRPDGSKRWVSVRGEVERDATGRIVQVRGTAQDITERKLAEQALREIDERFRTIANSAPVMIWMAGPDKLCTYFNKPWLDFTGRPLEAELGNGWTEGVHPDDVAQCMESYAQSFDRREAFRLEYRLRRHDGEYRWIADRGVPRFEADSSFAGYIGSCVDDTERRAGEEALRTVGRRLIQAQEQERKRIARELHDDINQRLAMVAVELQQLQMSPKLSGDQRNKRIEKLFEDTTNIASGIQALSHQLHSTRLDYMGLVPAIQGFCDELARQRQVKIDFVHSDVPGSLSADIALALFRVTQEALHNAVKYSGVRVFEVRLLGTDSHIELTVRDSGVGFGLDGAMQGRGLGLISMRERILPLKGTISIVAKPTRGTEITVHVPVEKTG